VFAAFLTTPEAQKTWEEFLGRTSAFIPGTRANKYVKTKKSALHDAEPIRNGRAADAAVYQDSRHEIDRNV